MIPDDAGVTPTDPLSHHYGQHGSVLVIALLVLLSVTILGVMGIHTSTVDLRIAGNEHRMRESFYLAEAAAVEGIQRLMKTEAVDLNEKHLVWHHSQNEVEAQSIDFRDPQDWDVDRVEPDNGTYSGVDENAFITAVERRVATGSSLIATQSRLYVNSVYGLCTKNHTDILIEIGYKSRY